MDDPGPKTLALARALRLAEQLGRVRTLLATGCAAEAAVLFDEIGDPGSLPIPLHADAWFLRGRLEKSCHHFPAAIAAYQRAIAVDRGFASAFLDLGNCLAEIERTDDAEESLRQALAIAPGLKEAHASLGSVLLMAGREAEAEQCYRAALAIDPMMVVAHQNLAAIAAANGRPAEARSHRDAAYRQQSLFIERAAWPEFTLLMPTTAEGGNVPWKFLFPRNRCTVLKWFVEYASEGEAERLPPYDLVFNGIGDADAAQPMEASLARFLATSEKPVLNRPAAVLNTRRDRLRKLLAGITDVVVPEVMRFDGTAATDEDIAFPILLRAAGSHGGAGVRLIHSLAELVRATEASRQSWYLTRFWPYCSADGWYRKYRIIFIGTEPFPYHLALSRHWLVHYVTADMLSDAAKNEEERAFLGNSEAAIGAPLMVALREIGRRLALDFAGIDFSILPDGRLLVFEANATMLVHPEPEPGPLAYRNDAIRRILDAFQVMVRFKLQGQQQLSRSAATNSPLQSVPDAEYPASARAAEEVPGVGL
ncbi:MAG: tetratricopeptide repeat protein [Acetobacteraceae bacterium]